MSPPEPTAHPDRSAPGTGSSILDRLNPTQREAVTHGGGPLLVLAGAGSGKTRVITHRIAHLILDRGVDSRKIVAVTFTNKAAAEMRERVESLIGLESLGSWIGTFHALCLRLLRRDGAAIGLAPGFNIYDRDDQIGLVRRLLREHDDGDAASQARGVLARISRAKNALESPEQLERRARSPEARRAARLFPLYQEALQRANAVDFDDLLLRTLDLFEASPETAEFYASHCEHLLVDEYQDTNRPQYLLVRALSARHGNILVVGDEDQSIYRFRGAEIRNILEFESDHPGTRVIKLEQNYRSTGTILKAASAVISRNIHRKGKELWTENDDGEMAELHHAATDRGEAVWAGRRARELQTTMPFEQMAVLYRTNAQSRQFEEIFRRDRIPYQVVGSVQFYERKEVKDLLSYLKLVANPADDVAFRRVVNTPTRGIGDTTVQAIAEIAQDNALPLMEAARHALARGLLSGRATSAVRGFVALIDDLRQQAGEKPVAGLLDGLVGAIDYRAYLEKTYPDRGDDRMENVQSLVTAAVEYWEEDDEATLLGFLDRSALVSDADEVGREPGVTMMTIHCAKGLEFDAVFLAGLEENLFPHVRSIDLPEEMEEERRLCYVALTRARKRLFVSHAGMRRVQGVPMPSAPSRFLEEIPRDLLTETHPDPADEPFDWNAPARPRARYGSGGSSAMRAGKRRRSGEPASRPAVGPDPGDGFAIGAGVVHPMFGTGYITAREGGGKHLKLTIRFSTHGSKKILPAYTKLRLTR
ncbi:MAG: UvrD-helicase domain-containing protein [Acidobacteriota bacterium]|nr:UvrD-helicase domain-containing protein [Acidobacteriota bacterium]